MGAAPTDVEAYGDQAEAVSAQAGEPGDDGMRQIWLRLRWIALGCVLAYMLSFGPVVWYANVTRQVPFRALLIATLSTLYAPHIWLAAQVQPYGEYCRWWQRLAQGGR